LIFRDFILVELRVEIPRNHVKAVVIVANSDIIHWDPDGEDIRAASGWVVAILIRDIAMRNADVTSNFIDVGLFQNPSIHRRLQHYQ